MERRAAGGRVRGRDRRVPRRDPVIKVPRGVFQRLLPKRPTPERCVEAYYLQRTRFEGIAERKLRRRQLAEDRNVEIGGRDLGRVPDDGGRADRRERLNSTHCGHSVASAAMPACAPHRHCLNWPEHIGRNRNCHLTLNAPAIR
jgi:hypothetical protein